MLLVTALLLFAQAHMVLGGPPLSSNEDLAYEPTHMFHDDEINNHAEVSSFFPHSSAILLMCTVKEEHSFCNPRRPAIYFVLTAFTSASGCTGPRLNSKGIAGAASAVLTSGSRTGFPQVSTA